MLAGAPKEEHAARQPVGVSLLANASCQAIIHQQVRRLREQAHSYRISARLTLSHPAGFQAPLRSTSALVGASSR